MPMSMCINAWQTLGSMRPHYLRPIPVPKAAPVMMPFRGEIPWSAIEQYATRHGLDRESLALLVEVIAQLDAKRSAEETNAIQRRPR